MKKLMLITTAAVILGAVSCTHSYTDLFNGKNLDGWNFVVENDSIPASDVYSVKDGMIRISGNPFGYMYTEKTYRDYDLEVEWAWEGKGSNSGIFLNISELGNPFPNCVECNLKAGNAGMFVLLGGAQAREYVLPQGEQRPKFPKIEMKSPSSENRDGEWNISKILVRDGNIKVYVNGVLQNECNDLCKKGHIGLQSEGGPVLFRSVRIRTI